MRIQRMGKRFKGTTCAYCGLPATTRDHVFARGFFPEDQRANLPQVAACERCNHAKSEIEHYLLTVLPFGNRTENASSMLEDMVPKRLAKNQKLHRELAEGQEHRDLVEEGKRLRSFAVPFDTQRYYAYFRYAARGLAVAHWNSAIPPDYKVSTGMVVKEQEEGLRSLFVLRSQNTAQGNLGRGLILYEGQQAFGNPHFTMWRFQVYGQMAFGDDTTSSVIQSDIWAITAGKPVPGLFAE